MLRDILELIGCGIALALLFGVFVSGLIDILL